MANLVRWKTIRKAGVALLLPLILLLVWFCVVEWGWVERTLWPGPGEVWGTAWEMAKTGELWADLRVSLERVLQGFVLAMLCAIPIGALTGGVRWLRELLAPTLEFFRQIPPVAWILPGILLLGTGEPLKLAIILYATFFPIYLNTQGAVARVDTRLVEVGRVFGLSTPVMLRQILLPGALPTVVSGLRLGLSNGWRALVMAELLAADHGLGKLLMEGRSLVRPDEMLVAVFCIGLAGWILDRLLLGLEHRLLPWYGGGRSAA